MKKMFVCWLLIVVLTLQACSHRSDPEKHIGKSPTISTNTSATRASDPTDDTLTPIIGSWYAEIAGYGSMSVTFNNDSTFSTTCVIFSHIEDLNTEEGTYSLRNNLLSLCIDGITDELTVEINDDSMFWNMDGFNNFKRVPQNSSIHGEWTLVNHDEEIQFNFHGRFCPMHTLVLFKDNTYIIKDIEGQISNRGRYQSINDNTTLSLDDYFYFTFDYIEPCVLLLTIQDSLPLILIRNL